MSFNNAYVQELSEETQKQAQTAFMLIWLFLGQKLQTGTDRNNKPVLRKLGTLLNQVTSEHKPDPALKARMAMKRMLQDTEGAREQARLKTAEAWKLAEEAKKAKKQQIDPNFALLAEFSKLLKVDEKV